MGTVETKKFPSDHEDAGQTAETRRYPSDVEDVGQTVQTKRYPSDEEDVGQSTQTPPGGPTMHTLRYPSDEEDVGGVVLEPIDGAEVKPARVEAMRRVFEAENNGKLSWKNAPPEGHCFTTVLLVREEHPDGYAFEALIPTGTLAPGAPQKDPNDVDTFWVRRSGGIAGMINYAGPFEIPRAHASPPATK